MSSTMDPHNGQVVLRRNALGVTGPEAFAIAQLANRASLREVHDFIQRAEEKISSYIGQKPETPLPKLLFRAFCTSSFTAFYGLSYCATNGKSIRHTILRITEDGQCMEEECPTSATQLICELACAG